MVTIEAGASGGTVTGGEYDVNVEGVINDGKGLSTPYSGNTGTYTAPNPTTGRFTVAITQNSTTANHVAYLVSGSQFLQLSTDALASDTAVLAGMAQLQSGSLSLTTGSNLVYNVTGLKSAELGLINVTGSTSFAATFYEDVAGTWESPQSPSCTYTIDTYGRVPTSGATCTMYLTTYSKMYPPVFYLTGPNTGVMLGTGAGVYVGQIEPQAAGPFTDASIAGTYYLGDLEVVSYGVASAESIGVGVVTLNSSGGYSITTDYTGTSGQDADTTQTGTLGVVNSNGTLGISSSTTVDGIIISSTEFLTTDNESMTYPTMQLIKQ
jgi:hypothetical protein